MNTTDNATAEIISATYHGVQYDADWECNRELTAWGYDINIAGLSDEEREAAIRDSIYLPSEVSIDDIYGELVIEPLAPGAGARGDWSWGAVIRDDLPVLLVPEAEAQRVSHDMSSVLEYALSAAAVEALRESRFWLIDLAVALREGGHWAWQRVEDERGWGIHRLTGYVLTATEDQVMDAIASLDTLYKRH